MKKVIDNKNFIMKIIKLISSVRLVTSVLVITAPCYCLFLSIFAFASLCLPPPCVHASVSLSTWLPVALPVRPTIYLSICECVRLRVVIRSRGCL